jgi:2-polyprenyl-6-methoxyphenol hydroxylase-like FAD-dependent oxidoreductase
VKALVIGGGVAGATAGMALQRAGIEVVVYETHAGSHLRAGCLHGH